MIGKADTEHMVPEAPRDPRNRRISITLLRQEPVAALRGRPQGDALRAHSCLLVVAYFSKLYVQS